MDSSGETRGAISRDKGEQLRHCSVCGDTVGSKRTVRAPDGRLVCETCVDEARQVLQARKAREARVEAELRKRKELERVEGDNRLVLELQADEWLRAAANSCPSCGRFIALADSMCHGCGYGAPVDAPKRAFSFGKRPKRASIAAAARVSPGGPVEDLLETLDARLIHGLPVLLAGLAVVGLLLSPWFTWTWSAAVIGMVVAGVGIFAGSAIILFRHSPKEAIPLVVASIFAAVATIIAGRTSRLELQVASAFGIAVMCGLACWIARRTRLDATLATALAGLGTACLVAAGVLASRM